EWIKGLLTDPAKLEKGLRASQEEKEAQNAPLYERLAVVEDLLGHHRQQYERLLDVYLTGEIPRDMLVDRKQRLEQSIAQLETEHGILQRKLEVNTLTSEQIKQLQEFARQVARGLESVDKGKEFATRRKIVQLLDVEITLTVEDGQQVAYASCILSKDSLLIASTSMNGPSTP
ncbi:MAG: hypothetical protein M3220_14560, partial [Chloroflexota bacterium]|nr:hypothetical protein [Chloroflexota bacterium]